MTKIELVHRELTRQQQATAVALAAALGFEVRHVNRCLHQLQNSGSAGHARVATAGKRGRPAIVWEVTA